MAQDIFNLQGSNKANRKWNYSKPNEPDYMSEIQGTIVEINKVNSYKFGSNQPEFWPDGNPKVNIQIIVRSDDGSKEWNWTISPKSNGFNALKQAIIEANLAADGNASVLDISGKKVSISTTGMVFDNGRNCRNWIVKVLGEGVHKFVGSQDLTFRHQQPAQQPMQQPMQQVPMQPMMQPQMAPQVPQQAYQQQAPAPQYVAPQPVPQMQGNFYAAPQAVTAQPMQQQQVYDDSIPF